MIAMVEGSFGRVVFDPARLILHDLSGLFHPYFALFQFISSFGEALSARRLARG
jgi:hypothetical protein